LEAIGHINSFSFLEKFMDLDRDDRDSKKLQAIHSRVTLAQ
jgi:hypothetical protein